MQLFLLLLFVCFFKCMGYVQDYSLFLHMNTFVKLKVVFNAKFS